MKFLAVCGFGVGSSMVLKQTIEKACRVRDIDCDVENTDLSSAKGANVDAIFTSAEIADDLKSSVKVPVFPIKRYMDKEEVGQALDEFLKNKG
ncbi:MAG TPA: PTS sugar transporter subunit IIB [Bacillota bacterium]|nr:PTS sugar transporter subunit IIB [Bacillota bacterium]